MARIEFSDDDFGLVKNRLLETIFGTDDSSGLANTYLYEEHDNAMPSREEDS